MFGACVEDVDYTSTYISYADGAICSTQYIASTTWVMFSPTDELVGSRGISLSLATNNVVEYSEIFKPLSEAAPLGIHHLIVRLDSQLVVSQLKYHYPSTTPLYSLCI